MNQKPLSYIACRAILCILLFSMGYAQPPAPQGSMWEVVPELTDEFDVWDNTKWRKVLWNYGEPVQMLASNSGVANGNLWIKATLDSGAVRWFETSRVMSRTKINHPMYTECRMKTAHISAYNTFWLNNGDIDNRDEIDVVENNSKPSCDCQPTYPYQMNSQYFQADQNAAPQTIRYADNFDNRNLSNDNPLKGVRWNEAYHVVGVWWKDSRNIQFYLDGEPAGTVMVGQHLDGNVYTEREFTRDLDIIWDLWTIDANWSGGIAAQEDLKDEQINTMYVDWIHTYRLVADPTASIEAGESLSTARIFPTVAKDLLNVELPQAPTSSTPLQIYDGAGRLVKTMTLQARKQQINVADLSPGVYSVRIGDQGAGVAHKFIKQ